jgi:hypothetical protein
VGLPDIGVTGNVSDGHAWKYDNDKIVFAFQDWYTNHFAAMVGRDGTFYDYVDTGEGANGPMAPFRASENVFYLGVGKNGTKTFLRITATGTALSSAAETYAGSWDNSLFVAWSEVDAHGVAWMEDGGGSYIVPVSYSGTLSFGSPAPAVTADAPGYDQSNSITSLGDVAVYPNYYDIGATYERASLLKVGVTDGLVVDSEVFPVDTSVTNAYISWGIVGSNHRSWAVLHDGVEYFCYDYNFPIGATEENMNGANWLLPNVWRDPFNGGQELRLTPQQADFGTGLEDIEYGPYSHDASSAGGRLWVTCIQSTYYGFQPTVFYLAGAAPNLEGEYEDSRRKFTRGPTDYGA